MQGMMWGEPDLPGHTCSVFGENTADKDAVNAGVKAVSFGLSFAIR